MTDKFCIHIFGASGSGTSTLGRAISEKYGFVWLDTDDYFWLPTNPRFTEKRDKAERIALLSADIEKNGKCVVSGSLCGWGDVLIPKFDLCIRIKTPTDIRIKRIEAREYARFGERIMPGGDMHEAHIAFIKWAESYDTADENSRSAAMHDVWQKKLPCPLIMLDGEKPISELLNAVAPYIK